MKLNRNLIRYVLGITSDKQYKISGYLSVYCGVTLWAIVNYEGGRSHCPRLFWGRRCKTMLALPRHRVPEMHCHSFVVTTLLSWPELSARHAARRLMKAMPSGSQPPWLQIYYSI